MLRFLRSRQVLIDDLAHALNELAEAKATVDYWNGEATRAYMQRDLTERHAKRLEEKADGYKEVVQQCRAERDAAVKALDEHKSEAAIREHQRYGEYY